MKDNYRTTLNTRPLMFLESRRVGKLLVKRVSTEEIRRQVIEEDLLQLPSISRRKIAVEIILKRLNYLDDYLITKFVEVDQDTARILLLYSILRNDQLFYEFMREVYWQSIISHADTLRKSDIINFITNKGLQSNRVKMWTDGTKRRLADAYQQILTETQLLQDEHIKNSILTGDVRQYLIQNGDKQRVEILIGRLIS
ncbi:DUF1819 family protein [Latilactobacillus sakei]|uniref:DUF1819 family protein n=1 Tax=Latilactobacillus sakei TaxID=1599 RepID=UPI000C1272E9|nr:DUF1819 family protein [Latilactobacillus sakei]USG08768.1 hypothetical protein A4W83_09690 [Latilactobacillus sakei]USG12439.1 hypothetical protein A4W85_09675 [Latilactobacillus sakei]SOB41224.1 conserved hypothetical protein [Latilactobacillus sakei]SON74196.1 conserved protein of unknown function [Latilactobacillus sakei]